MMNTIEEDLNHEIEAIPYYLHKNYIKNHEAELKIMMQSASKQDLKDKIHNLTEKIDMFEQDNIIEWAPLSIVAKKKGLTKDAIRKQLQNGDYEEGVDFKHEGNKIVVHQGAIGRLQRKRRSNNG